MDRLQVLRPFAALLVLASAAACGTAPAPTALATALPVLPEAVPLASATYKTVFDPPLTMTGMRGEADVSAPSWIDYTEEVPGAELVIMRLDEVFDLESGVASSPPPDLANWIAAHYGLTVETPPHAVRIGNVDGVQLDVMSGSAGVAFGPIPGVNDPPAGLPADRLARITVVQPRGHNVLVIELAADGGKPAFDAAIESLLPVVDGMIWAD